MNFINNIKTVFQTTDKIIWIDISKIIIDPEFENIFIQKENEIANISENMKENGFDPAHPIILATSKEHPELNNINADGHTRYKAAMRAGFSKVAIIYKEFTDRESLLKFVYEQQLLRRNLSESEIFKSWEALNRLTNKDGKKAKSDTKIAEELKISRRQVAKMKEIVKKAPSEVVEQVKTGEVTLNKAYTKLKQNDDKADRIDNQLSKKKNSSNEEEKYLQGFKDGYKYVLELIKIGKPIQELEVIFNDLKKGKVTTKEILKKLLVFKESNEQKKTK